jgi:hypothetical protein
MWLIFVQTAGFSAIMLTMMVSFFGFWLMFREYQNRKRKFHFFSAAFFLLYFASWAVTLLSDILSSLGRTEIGFEMAVYVFIGSIV